MTLSDPLARLEEELMPLQAELETHPLYAMVSTRAALQVFMEHHVFAVWDFMSLLKTLQRELTCVDVPWVPRGDPASRRFINEIVLGEESDEDGLGGYASHFDLYRHAMTQVGASARSIDEFLRLVTQGSAVPEALVFADAPAPADVFVRMTWSTIESRSPSDVAAAFTYGREDPIPGMFSRLLSTLDAQDEPGSPVLRYYLQRHIDLDGDHHGPLARQLVERLCGSDEARWASATRAARKAIQGRLALWDGVVAALESQRAVRTTL